MVKVDAQNHILQTCGAFLKLKTPTIHVVRNRSSILKIKTWPNLKIHAWADYTDIIGLHRIETFKFFHHVGYYYCHIFFLCTIYKIIRDLKLNAPDPMNCLFNSIFGGNTIDQGIKNPAWSTGPRRCRRRHSRRWWPPRRWQIRSGPCFLNICLKS